MTPEGKVKDVLKIVLKAAGIYYFMPRGTALGRSGIPDFVCCFHGAFIGIECKAKGKENNLSALQKYELTEIRKSGGLSFVFSGTTYEDAAQFLETVEKALVKQWQSKSQITSSVFQSTES